MKLNEDAEQTTLVWVKIKNGKKEIVKPWSPAEIKAYYERMHKIERQEIEAEIPADVL